MSRELKGTKLFYLTQFQGPASDLEECGSRKNLQVTDKETHQYLRMNKHNALELASAILEWYNGARGDRDED